MRVTQAHITRQASKDGVPAPTVERDLVLSHVVIAIAEHTRSMEPRALVLKGGTSLRLLHFAEYRYSADLDYSVVGATEVEGLGWIRAGLAKAPRDQIRSLELTDDHPARIAYVGPLGRERRIKLDLADDEYVAHTERRALLPRWPGLPDVDVLAYSTLEVAAEKLRCVLQRRQCRDLFDIDILFHAGGVDLAATAALFRIKAKHRGLDPNTFAQRYRARMGEYERVWAAELSEHIPGNPPHFEQVARRVGRALRSVGLL